MSKSLYKEFIEAYPILKKCKCFVLHNSVNTNIFKNRTKSLNIINIIFLSAWVEDKGIYYLPEIINKVNLVYKNKVKFIIGGSLRLWSLPEEEYQKYRHIAKQINKLKYTFSNVEVIGAVEYKKVPDLLNKATFTLLPSIWEEPYSLLAIESLSSGTPVIAFKVGGNKEIISNKTNGHLVSTPSPSEMSRLIINIIKDFKVNDYKKMSHAARLSAARYTVDDRNMRLKNILLNGLGA